MPGAGFFFIAFRDLQTCRHPDGAIPWTASRLYAQDKGLAPDVADALWIIVHKMDVAERVWRSEQWESGHG